MLLFPPEKVALSPRHPLAQIHDGKASIYTRTQKAESNAEQEHKVLMVVRERQRQERGSGSRGVTALTERSELPGWVLRCDAACKHDRAESAKSGRQEQQMLRLVN